MSNESAFTIQSQTEHVAHDANAHMDEKETISSKPDGNALRVIFDVTERVPQSLEIASVYLIQQIKLQRVIIAMLGQSTIFYETSTIGKNVIF